IPPTTAGSLPLTVTRIPMSPWRRSWRCESDRARISSAFAVIASLPARGEQGRVSPAALPGAVRFPYLATPRLPVEVTFASTEATDVSLTRTQGSGHAHHDRILYRLRLRSARLQSGGQDPGAVSGRRDRADPFERRRLRGLPGW